jgi:hypothetical protein
MTNANAKKVTKRDFYGMIIELATENGRNDIVEFAQHEIDLLNNKAGKSTLTATQKENENIKEVILAELEKIGKPVTITELLINSEALNKYTNPKITALCTQLLKVNKIVRVQDKKKAYYSIAD